MDLSGEMYQKILDFYADLPYCRIKVEWTCPVCGKKNVQYVNGFLNFFV